MLDKEQVQNTYKPNNTRESIQVPGMALRSNAGIPAPSETQKNLDKKAIFFIDANNWYHNIKRYYNPSEIDVVKLVKLLCEVNYLGLKPEASTFHRSRTA